MQELVGAPSPLGVTISGEGVNFALFSSHATRAQLHLFDHSSDSKASHVIDLDRTGDVWHVMVKGIGAGQLYAYRLEGPYDPKAGHRFNQSKLLLDPLAPAITRLDPWDFTPALGYQPGDVDADLIPSSSDDAAQMPKCVVMDNRFDWSGDKTPCHPWSKVIIYEAHVRGLTIHPTAGVKHPGTYRGLIEKIPYLKKLGVTTVELLPVQEFNHSQVTSALAKSLKNYWGYDPILFLAPKASYSSLPGIGEQVGEFKEMVRAFHQEGIEIILDVVYNHTAETDAAGATLNLRGIDNACFYILEEDKRRYRNYTGTGNTLNANHPMVQEYILSALRYWAREMHVDGFRFDLATILARDTNGNLLADSPVLQKIANDPVLKNVKLIAEPWDAVGGYQLGSFSARRWSEWNDKYRDVVRRFWRGDEGMLGAFASRLCGSADIFTASGKGPQNSINFVTCHDGFTLNDLVSYNAKHNEANCQDNQDGSNDNYSSNYGIEGPSADTGIESLRRCQIKNFLLTLLLSRGVPMILGGDEMRRTQAGNNNAYAQDNETSWYNWDLLKQHEEIFTFTQRMIAFRREHPILRKEQFYTDAEIQWFSAQGADPDWGNPANKQLGCLIREDQQRAIFLIFNAGGMVHFNLPAAPTGGSWRVVVDTSVVQSVPEKNLQEYSVNPHSSVILLNY